MSPPLHGSKDHFYFLIEPKCSADIRLDISLSCKACVFIQHQWNTWIWLVTQLSSAAHLFLLRSVNIRTKASAGPVGPPLWDNMFPHLEQTGGGREAAEVSGQRRCYERGGGGRGRSAWCGMVYSFLFVMQMSPRRFTATPRGLWRVWLCARLVFGGVSGQGWEVMSFT